MKQSIRGVAALLLVGALVNGCASDHSIKGSQTEAGFQPVDLTHYYDKLAGSWPPGNSWSAVPWGHHTYDGVPFEWGGILEVTGIDAARNVGEVFPGRYTGLPVGRTAAWIHLVHGVGWREADGVPIARLRLHYENGQTSTLPIIYGVHVRNWWKEPSETETALADPNSRPIWSAPSPEQVGRPITLRLYKTSFANPHPGWVITALDVESLFTHATPVVVAITTGSAGERVGSQHVPPVAIPYLFTSDVVVRAADTGKPVPGAHLQIVLSDGERNYPFGEQITDTAGIARLDFCRVQTCRLALTVSAPGYDTLRFGAPILNLRPELELKLQSQSHSASVPPGRSPVAPFLETRR